jgi:hypothetical protein
MRRLATPEDFDTVFALYMHEKVVPYLGYDPMPLEDFRAIYQGLLDGGGFYIYEREGTHRRLLSRHALSGPRAARGQPRHARRRPVASSSALVSTLTLDSAIAAPATTGLR